MAFNKAKALQEAQKHVIQGKTSQAIKQYLQIIEKDPADLILLNTVGDLYIRDKNIREGLKQFYKLADTYMKEGFAVKAIAIYKKISKIDQGSIEPVLKLGELYLTQGLQREAREQFTTALEFYSRKNQQDQALEIARKIAQLDPNNPRAFLRWADSAEKAGDNAQAAQAYLEAATAAQRQEDAATAEGALKKALQLDPANPRAQLFRARQAYRKRDFDEVEKIITSAPQLKDDPTSRRLLLECYLASQKLEPAEQLLLEVFHSNPADFSPVSNFVSQCVARGNFDAAFKAVNAVAGALIERKNTDALMEALRKIWAQAPQHLDTLELIYKICEKTADEFTLPEILEALSHAYVQTDQLDKAEGVYRKLLAREPENEHYKGLLKQVLQKEGKEYIPASADTLSAAEMAFETPGEAVSGGNPEEAAMVKEALDNSDLYVRYSLTEKAVAELEKVLAVYPNQIDIHKRMVEACRKNHPARGAQAAEALARIFGDRGNAASAERYQEVARQLSGTTDVSGPSLLFGETTVPSSATTVAPQSAEFDLSQGSGATEAIPPKPREIPLDLTSTPPQEGEGWIPTPGFQPAGEASPAIPAFPSDLEAETPPFNYKESYEEINFYLKQGLGQEARKALEQLEVKYPGNPEVAQLRELLETLSGVETCSTEAALPANVPAAVGEAGQEWELPTSFAEPAPAEEKPAVEPAPSPGGDLLGDLAGDLASSLEGLDTPEGGPAAPFEPLSAPAAAEPPGQGASADFSGLLAELDEEEPTHGTGDDPETHYNLGVAFREMGLLDEAIGEFQKVLKGTQKGSFPPNFLQVCTLLAVCFMDKGMPQIAAKWYARALETPDLDEEATLTLQYDLGVAYEQAGDSRTALQKFTEVYSQNIDYRDVAEKIRLLQEKTS